MSHIHTVNSVSPLRHVTYTYCKQWVSFKTCPILTDIAVITCLSLLKKSHILGQCNQVGDVAGHEIVF